MYRRLSVRPVVIATVLLLGAVLPGCQAGRTYVLASPAAPAHFGAVNVREAVPPGTTTGTAIDPELKSEFERALSERLGPLEVRPDGDLTLSYRFVLYDSGSGPTRVGALLVGIVGVPTGSLGNGTVAVEATFTDASGAELARIVADGPIDGAFGSTRGGLKTAAGSIAEFARAHFSAFELRSVAMSTGTQ